MKKDELRALLERIRINQVNLAKLLGVTPRSVNLWITGTRNIPGPVAAYVRLLSSLPIGMQQAELAKIITETRTMKEGMYFVEYAGATGQGGASLIFEGGRIFGSDLTGGKYDGEYQFNEQTGLVDVSIKIQMPANVQSVVGIKQPFDWILDVSSTMNSDQDSGTLEVRTKHDNSRIDAKYRFMRSIPLAT